MAPRRLPKPTQRSGLLTYEIRTRLGGKIVTRSLRTRDYDEALRRVPRVYDELVRKQHARAGAADPPVPPVLVGAHVPTPSILSVEDVCRRYRERHLACERQFRIEFAAGGIDEPVRLAGRYKKRLQSALSSACSRAIVYDFRHEEWFLTYLSRSGVGEVADRPGALLALARTAVVSYQEILASDANLGLSSAPLTTLALPGKASLTPLLSKVLQDFLSERAPRMTAEVALEHRAIVRDLTDVVGDRPVAEYGREDARVFKEVLLTLPSNWTKRKTLRGLGILEAAQRAKEFGLPRQAAKSIQLKRAMVKRIFSYASQNYAGVDNPFEGKFAWVVADAAAANQRDAFTAYELGVLLRSNLPRELYWLTWLGLYTGARLNELCQLTIDHVRSAHPPHLYFGPDLRLKTSERTGSSIRAVPLHPKLISIGFLEFVAGCKGNPRNRLFPDLPRHRTGRYSDAPSKAFRRHLTVLDIKRPGLSFHSLRHTFASEFRRCAPQEVETRERLMGHHVPGIAGRYGSSYVSEASDNELLLQRAKVVGLLRFGF